MALYSIVVPPIPNPCPPQEFPNLKLVTILEQDNNKGARGHHVKWILDQIDHQSDQAPLLLWSLVLNTLVSFMCIIFLSLHRHLFLIKCKIFITYPTRQGIPGKDRPCFPVEVMPVLSVDLFSYPINILTGHSSCDLQELVSINQWPHSAVKPVERVAR